MPSLDPETSEWIERAQRGEKPYSYIKKNGMLVVSLIMDYSFTIQGRVSAEGHAWWRAINPSTVRPRRIRMRARLRDGRGFWKPDQKVQGDDYCIEGQIPRTKKSDETYSKRNWSARFVAQELGAEAVTVNCYGCKEVLESEFIIDTLRTAKVGSSGTSRRRAEVVRKVFISHSSQDKQFVRKLAADLRERNLDVWFDEHSRVGESFVDNISKRMEDTDYFILVLSAAAAQSLWVTEELNAALVHRNAGKGVAVLPVRLDETELPVLLRSRLYADFREDYKRGLESLLQALGQER